MEKLYICFTGEPMPAPRPRGAARDDKCHFYNLREYTDYKSALAGYVQCKYGFWAWDIPPTSERTARSKYIKSHRYILDVAAFRSKETGDNDNFMKPCMDALQIAGVFANDSQIDYGEHFKDIDKENPRIEFRLRRLTPEKKEEIRAYVRTWRDDE